MTVRIHQYDQENSELFEPSGPQETRLLFRSLRAPVFSSWATHQKYVSHHDALPGVPGTTSRAPKHDNSFVK